MAAGAASHITVKLFDRSAVARFDHSADKISESLDQWQTIQRNLVASIVQHKPTTVQHYSNDPSFQINKLILRSDLRINKISRDGVDYSSVFGSDWLADDLKILTSSVEFHLSQLWFQFHKTSSSPNTDTQSADPSESVRFFQMVDKVALGEEVSGISALGLMADGEELTWVNPGDEMMATLPSLVINCCKELNVDVNIDDRRGTSI